MAVSAAAMASDTASRERGAAFRMSVLSLAKTCSIGLQLNTRVQGTKAPKDLREKRDRIVIWAPEAHRAAQARSSHVCEDFVMPGQKRLGVRQQSFAGCRETHTRSASVQERLADQVFQALHLHAERRLCPPDLQTGNADRARARNHGEASEQCKIGVDIASN
jgi:hypothetical protein